MLNGFTLHPNESSILIRQSALHIEIKIVDDIFKLMIYDCFEKLKKSSFTSVNRTFSASQQYTIAFQSSPSLLFEDVSRVLKYKKTTHKNNRRI